MGRKARQSHGPEPLAGADSDWVVAYIADWLLFRRRFRPRAQPVARTYEKPSESNQRAWHSYVSKKQNGGLGQEWLMVPMWRPFDPNLSNNSPSHNLWSGPLPGPATGGRYQHYTNVHRIFFWLGSTRWWTRCLLTRRQRRTTTVFTISKGDALRGTSRLTTCI